MNDLTTKDLLVMLLSLVGLAGIVIGIAILVAKVTMWLSNFHATTSLFWLAAGLALMTLAAVMFSKR